MHEMLAVMTSILYFSSTKPMVVMRPGLWAVQMENWASSPKMFKTKFEEAQVLSKATGNESAFEVVPIIALEMLLLEDPWPVTNMDGSHPKVETHWTLSCFCFSSFSRVFSRFLMYATASSTTVDLSAYERWNIKVYVRKEIIVPPKINFGGCREVGIWVEIILVTVITKFI